MELGAFRQALRSQVEVSPGRQLMSLQLLAAYLRSGLFQVR